MNIHYIAFILLRNYITVTWWVYLVVTIYAMINLYGSTDVSVNQIAIWFCISVLRNEINDTYKCIQASHTCKHIKSPARYIHGNIHVTNFFRDNASPSISISQWTTKTQKKIKLADSQINSWSTAKFNRFAIMVLLNHIPWDCYAQIFALIIFNKEYLETSFLA